MKWKRLLKDYLKLNEEDKNLFKLQLEQELKEEPVEIEGFVEDEKGFDFQKELEDCDCDCDCDCKTEDEFEYLQKLDMRIAVASNLLHNITKTDGTPYFSAEWVVENILKMKKL